MALDDIAWRYGIPAKHGQRVRYTYWGKAPITGRICGYSGAFLRIRPDGEVQSFVAHPDSPALEFLTADPSEDPPLPEVPEPEPPPKPIKRKPITPLERSYLLGYLDQPPAFRSMRHAEAWRRGRDDALAGRPLPAWARRKR